MSAANAGAASRAGGRVENSFVTVEGRGVGVTESGDIYYDADSTDPIRVTARSGWLVNDSESVTLTPSSGTLRRLSASSKLDEDDKHIHCFPCVTNDVHLKDIEISAVASPVSQAAMYAVPDTGTVVSASAQEVVKPGRHYWKWELKPCECGEPPPEPSSGEGYYDVVPERYEWTAEAAGLTFEESTWTGMMTKGAGQTIDFDVTGKRDACEKCTCQAHTTAKVDVYELSIERPDYLGLDMTDAMKGKYVKRDATAKIDPKPAKDEYSWKTCGRCKFMDATDKASVTYGGNDKTGGSESYLAEPLTVFAKAWNEEGQSASATCTTNFTVVQVDVGLKDWGEPMDEKNDTIIGTYVKRDGTGLLGGYPVLAKKAMTQCPVEIKVLPENQPAEEKVTLAFKDENLIVDEEPEIAKDSYGVREINSQKFYLFNEKGAPTQKEVKATHDNSFAVDVVKYDVCCCTFTLYTDVSALYEEGAWYEQVISFLGGLLDSVGHSFCKIDIDAEHKHLVPEHLTKYIGTPYGFYPAAENPHGKAEEYYDVVSDFHDENEHFKNVNGRKPLTAMHVWHISLGGCVKGLERMYEIETTKPNYDLMCFNCTDAAISIGRACGAPVPLAGIGDISVLESLRGLAKGNDDWAQKVWNLCKDSDGSYSSPLVLLILLKDINMVCGEIE